MHRDRIYIVFAAFFFLHFFGLQAHGACNISTTSMVFPPYDVFLAVPTDTNSTVTVTCDTQKPSPVILSLGASLNSGGFNPRQMKHTVSADLLVYNIYSDKAFTAVLGDGTGGGTLARQVTRNKPWVPVLYGRIPALQNATVGTYTDVLTVTVTW
ncbi:MAG: spore coat protein U domain-containing protein [Deltaproteobacteria bacterium]|nr:spore coat protein U domain-containing protein [Deltaproteobacteria bacterium]